MDWMSKSQKQQFREVCELIDQIKSPRDFYRIMEQVNRYPVDIVTCAREFKRCFNSIQYE